MTYATCSLQLIASTAIAALVIAAPPAPAQTPAGGAPASGAMLLNSQTWQGQVLNSYLPVYGPYFEIDGEWRSYAKSLFTMAQNWKLDRATVSYADPANPVGQSRISYPDSFFNVDQLARQGK